MKIILKDGLPYSDAGNFSASTMARFVEEGTWVRADLERYGFQAADTFVTPSNKVRTGAPRYIQVDGVFWREEYDVIDPPPPSAEDVRQTSFKAEPDAIDLVTRLQSATPAQINSWIDANVSNIAQARAVLKALVKVLVRVI